jgi:tetratricopeptide (TPR) repeat protein
MIVFCAIFYIILCLSLIGVVGSDYIDPADYFLSSSHRPKLGKVVSFSGSSLKSFQILEIIVPVNGQVLDSGELKIVISVAGYEIPSNFEGSKICLAFSSGNDYSESCFEQMDLTFHVSGLAPGKHFVLRVILYGAYCCQIIFFFCVMSSPLSPCVGSSLFLLISIDKGNAVAVSVRNFRVAGIKGILPDVKEDSNGSSRLMTIKSALQVAVQYQTKGMEAQAESIYRSVLAENPSYPDALHLLGVVLYQRGDTAGAVQFFEQAVKSSGNATSYAVFYNTLGACYRTMGRIDEAEKQFQIALNINPEFISAIFNLGLVYQQKYYYSKAIELYQNVSFYAALHPHTTSTDTIQEAKIRECDLKVTLHRYSDALDCWNQAVVKFPTMSIIFHELAHLQAQLGHIEYALDNYRTAYRLGRPMSELNVGHILESLGYSNESEIAFNHVLNFTISSHLPSYYIKVRLATSFPKIMPILPEILSLRENQTVSFLTLMNNASEIEIDNTSPLTMIGYSTGFHYLYHSVGSNVEIKNLLYRLYLTLCPALSQGYFIGSSTANDSSTAISVSREKENRAVNGSRSDSDDFPSSFPSSSNSTIYYDQKEGDQTSEEVNMNQQPSASFISRSTADSSTSASIDTTLPAVNKENSIVTAEVSSGGRSKNIVPSITSMKKPLKIGFISKYFFHHFVGILSVGLLELLCSPRINYPGSKEIRDLLEIHIIFIDGGFKGSLYNDHLQNRLINLLSPLGRSHYIHSKQDLGKIAEFIRSFSFDIIVYPEIGLDPLVYFLSFSRLAPVQAVWIGNPDTTGIETIDYFISTDQESYLSPPSVNDSAAFSSSSTTLNLLKEEENQNFEENKSKSLVIAQENYIEKLYPFSSFGTMFIDYYRSRAILQHQAPRTVLLNRIKFLESINLSKLTHLYFVPFSSVKLHPDFDIVIRKILLLDPLSFIFIYEAGPPRISWQQIVTTRMLIGLDQELKERILFPAPVNPLNSISLLQLAHVVLDPFPISGPFDSTLSALAMGVPVVTMPSTRHVAGRFTYGLYQKLGYGISESHDDSREKLTEENEAYNRNNSDSLPPPSANEGNSVVIEEKLIKESQFYKFHEDDNEGSGAIQNGKSLYSRLVVHSVQEYIQTAMKIAHQSKVRHYHTTEIMKRRDRLFAGNASQIAGEWKDFFLYAYSKRTPVTG